jgi:hypothetical protein
MNPITIGMDLLLAGLLVAALVMGARLNGRLKALKAGQDGFVQAVGELDAAARRADGALRELRKAGDETHDSLLARIETARALCLKLEKASEGAEKAAARAEETALRSPVVATLPMAPAPAGVTRRTLSELIAAHPARPAAREAAREALRGVDPLAIDQMFEGAAEARLAEAPRPEARRADPRRPEPASPRRRPIADEDLFADAGDALRPDPVRPDLDGLRRMSLARAR